MLHPDCHDLGQVNRAPVTNGVAGRQFRGGPVVETVSVAEITEMPPNRDAGSEAVNPADDPPMRGPAHNPAARRVLGDNGYIGCAAGDGFDPRRKLFGAVREVSIHLHENVEVSILKTPLQAREQRCPALASAQDLLLLEQGDASGLLRYRALEVFPCAVRAAAIHNQQQIIVSPQRVGDAAHQALNVLDLVQDRNVNQYSRAAPAVDPGIHVT